MSAGAISGDGRYAAMQQFEDIPSPDGEGSDHALVTRLWETATGEQVGVVTTSVVDGMLVAVGPAGKRVLLAGDDADDGWMMMDVATGEVVWERQMEIGQWPRPEVVALTPDGEFVAIDVIEITDMDEYLRLVGAEEDVHPALTRYIAMVDASTGEVRRMINVKINGEIPEVFLDPTGQCVLANYADGRIIRWSLASGERMDEITAGRLLVASPGGRYVVTLHAGCRVPTFMHVSDMVDGRPLSVGGPAGVPIPPPGGREDSLAMWGVAISGDGSLLATGHVDGKMQLWDVATGAEAAALAADPRHIQSLAISRDGSMAYIVRTDGGAHLLDTVSGEWHDANGVDFRVACMAMLTNNATVVGGYGGELAITETLTRLEQSPIYAPQLLAAGDGRSISALVVSDDGRYMAAANCDGQVQLWDMTSRELLWQRAQGDYVHSLAFGDGLGARRVKDPNNPDAWAERPCGPGADMLAAAGNGGIVVWDVLDGSPLSVLPETYTGSMAFSADGESVFTVWDGEVIQLDWRTGKQLKVYNELETWLWGGHASRIALCPRSDRLYVLEIGGFLGFGTQLKLGVIDLARKRSVLAARGVRLELAGEGTPEANDKFVDHFGMPVYVSPSGVMIETGRFGVVNIWRLGEAGE